MAFPNIPYNAIIIDSCPSEFVFAAKQASRPHSKKERQLHVETLQKLWQSESNPNHVLPCLCVRTALDLYLTVKAFPPGSEVLMSAVNIPDMAMIVRHHKLKVVPVDINLETFEPKAELMKKLVTSKTVAILVAHLCGRWINMEPIVAIAIEYNLVLIEDCAESFCGFSKTGHPQTDLALFSFGVIKFLTSFGGAIAKIKKSDDFVKMNNLHYQYPVQSGTTYLKKVLKYSVMFSILQTWPMPQLIQFSRQMGKDWKDTFVSFVRGFPSDLIPNIRYQPSSPLISVMAHKHQSFDKSDFDLQGIKGDYLLTKLGSALHAIGTKVEFNNYWLFPVISEQPDLLVKCLGVLGVDAYRGATQLKVVEPDDKNCEHGPNLITGEYISPETQYPQNAHYYSNHVVYLPVNKFVPFHVIDHMAGVCRIVDGVMDTHKSEHQALSKCKSWLKAKL